VCGFFLAGLGSDSGGSIRIPSAFCGVTGLVPTFGLVPKSGVAPLAFSLDHVGPMARTAWDCGAVLNAIAGPHPSDPDSADRPPTDYLAGVDEGIAGLRVGVVREHHLDGASPAVAAQFETAMEALGELGAEVTEVALPLYHEVTSATLITVACEACAYHAPDLATRWADYTMMSRLIMMTGVLTTGAEYVQAQRVRRLAQRKIADLFGGLDLIVTPTISATAPRLDAVLDPENGARLHTMYWNAIGNPLLAVPIGFVDGLPVSMQMAAAPWSETTLLRAGRAFQQHTGWHSRVPDLEAIHG
jgi:aspartyl-tRNA(Asn)/glutamyl-tRNA(Gln) amidotransferase subunit A